MPEFLKDYLKGLNPEQKDKVWQFLDSDPSAIQRMISMVGTEDGSSNQPGFKWE